MNRFVLPLVVFFGLSVLLWRGLALNPREIPSALIDKAAPEFSLPQLHDEQKLITHQTLTNEVWLLNVWASWCVACQQEHPVIAELAKEVDIVGLNYKDAPANARKWLEEYGNPYLVSGIDRTGDVGIDYGVYGVPETFIIDKRGRIRYKHIGPVSADDASQLLLPIIERLRRDIN